MECHHLWSVPEHKFDEGFLLHFLECNCGLLKQLQWMWWPFRGKERDLPSKDGYAV